MHPDGRPEEGAHRELPPRQLAVVRTGRQIIDAHGLCVVHEGTEDSRTTVQERARDAAVLVAHAAGEEVRDMAVLSVEEGQGPVARTGQRRRRVHDVLEGGPQVEVRPGHR